jgi:hypothetical protein
MLRLKRNLPMKKLINPLFIILLAALFRLIPHMPNFAPITAMALFGGTYLGRRYALVVPLLVMLLSDYLLLYVNPFSSQMFNFSHIYPPQALFHSTTLAVYGSFLVSGLVGLWLKNHKSPATVIASALFCSIQFFLITNAAVWIAGMYDRSILGLWESYIAGILFFRGTLMGDLTYTIVLFGGYELVLKLAKSRKFALA